MGLPRLLLSASVPAGKGNIDAGFDIPNVVRSLDFINIMTYDLHGSWDPLTGHNSPLYGRADESHEDALLNMASYSSPFRTLFVWHYFHICDGRMGKTAMPR